MNHYVYLVINLDNTKQKLIFICKDAATAKEKSGFEHASVKVMWDADNMSLTASAYLKNESGYQLAWGIYTPPAVKKAPATTGSQEELF